MYCRRPRRSAVQVGQPGDKPVAQRSPWEGRPRTSQPGPEPLEEDAGLGKAFTDDWWVATDRLASMAERVTGVGLTAAVRPGCWSRATVELLVLLTCWPSTSAPARPLDYLRSRQARMAQEAPCFYELPLPVRSLLAGRGRAASLLAVVVRPCQLASRCAGYGATR